MQIVRLICDRCYREEQEDDATGWVVTKNGRDLCPSCQFPFRASRSVLGGEQ